MNFENLNRPDTKLKPEAGRLLIAEPLLGDPNFSRSVVLLCEHSNEGSVGLILGHITELNIGDVLPELDKAPVPLSEGGPVQTDTLHILHRVPHVLGGKEILPGVYWGGTYDGLEEIINHNQYEPDKLRVFLGYAGWSPGQLDRELLEGSWIVSASSTGLLFNLPYGDVWKRALDALGKSFAYIANMPINPQLN